MFVPSSVPVHLPDITSPGRVGARMRHLPKHFRDKARLFAKRDAAERSKHQAESQQRRELSEHRDDLARRIAHLEEHKQHGRVFTEEDEAELKQLSAEHAEVVAELRSPPPPPEAVPFKKLPIQERARAAFMVDFATPVADFLQACDDLTRFVSKRAELPKLTKGKSLADALAENRVEQDALISKIVALESAPLDLEAALAGMRRDVAKLAESGAPNIAGVTTYKKRTIGAPKRQGNIRWPEQVFFTPGLSDSGSTQLGNSMLAWLFRDELTARLESDIRSRYAAKPGCSIESREDAEKSLRSELLELQRVDSRIVAELLARGEPVEIRPLHPLAMLECDFGERAKTKPAQEALKVPAHSTPIGGFPLTAEQAAGWRASAGGKAK